MKHKLVLALACLLMLAAGCSERSTEPVTQAVQEVEQFPVPEEIIPWQDGQGGLEEYYTLIEEATGLDEQVASATVTHYDAYEVKLLWGSLTGSGGSYDPTPTDWSGLLSLEGEGMIVVTETIDFEPGQDSVLPYSTGRAVAWVSQTAGDFDGLALQVYVNTNVTYITAPFLNLVTAPCSVRIPLPAESFDTVIHVDNVNSVAIGVVKLGNNNCPHGTLHGRWVAKDRHGGFFFGRRFDAYSHHIGYLAGRYRTCNDGRRTFCGMFVDLCFHWEGRIWGVWDYTPWTFSCVNCRWPHGYFEGYYSDRNSEIQGELGGRFGLPTTEAVYTGSYFSGWWRANCPAAMNK